MSGFGLQPTDRVFLARGESSRWDEGRFVPFGEIAVSPAAAVLSYGLGVFEGLKARRTPEGRVLLFRPSAHARRFAQSADRLLLPPFPEERCLAAFEELVRRNLRWLPPAGEGELYLRPQLFASEPRLGLGPCTEVTVVMYASPVGSYFAADEGPGIRLLAARRARCAPGMGAAKSIANYAGTLPVVERARREGWNDLLFVDPGRETVGETSGSNVFFLLASGVLVTPPLDDDLFPGITRDSVLAIVRDRLRVPVEERQVTVDEILSEAREAFGTGTAWSTARIGEIAIDGRVARLSGDAVRRAVASELSTLHRGEAKGPADWQHEVAGADSTELC